MYSPVGGVLGKSRGGVITAPSLTWVKPQFETPFHDVYAVACRPIVVLMNVNDGPESFTTAQTGEFCIGLYIEYL